MSKHELENVELTNMCMVFDKKSGKVLVQNRIKKGYTGIAFPGGHTEKGEAIVPSVIREVKEETGLTISNVVPCGFKDWYDKKENKRYIVMFFKTSSFSGELIEECHEGNNLWLTIDEVKKSKTANDFLDMLDIFTGESGNVEMFFEEEFDDKDNIRWNKVLY